jgi:uncharacterized damage-inducible protein DinB
MDVEEMRTLLDYHYWARNHVLDAAAALDPDQLTRDLRSSFPSVRETLVHTYAAERVWFLRFNGESPTSMPGVEALTTIDALREAWSALELQVRAFVDALGDEGLRRTFPYRLFSGAAGTSTYAQALQHLVNHASYHRGQVTTMLRQLGAAPPRSMDLVAFYRSRPQIS